MGKFHIAVVQMNSCDDYERNMAKLCGLLAGVGAVDIIVLPEVFSARGDMETYKQSAQPVNGAVIGEIRKISKERKVWILAGTVVEIVNGKTRYNTSVLVNRDGNVAAVYRKIHLFEAILEDGRVIRESDYFDSGSDPVVTDMEVWRAGLSVCYDIRFPEMYRYYSKEGMNLAFVPSDFTQRTGRDHWEVLLRARAIENQCFVIAPNQCGSNHITGVASYGNSMVVGPWGEVLCRAGDEETVLLADLDIEDVAAIRKRIPAQKARRGNVSL